ncbi:MAG: TetR/AcrR family transcriptional regulator [Roseovarius sp.]|jgi:AcrR family transcriptional regulator|uniref:TetR/AcrR family transcriptional regulator n=1 Tax=Roseovarius sp. TaxID=1486281 RepID=UPI0032ED4FDA
MPPSHCYPQSLAAEAIHLPKGQRTAQAIRIAACHLLEHCAPQDLTIAAICREAGIANGTFYLYFPDQAQLLDDLLQGFASFLQTRMIDAGHTHPDAPMRAATEAYVTLFEVNRGLMKCLIHHLYAFPAARAAFHRLNRDWIATVVRATRRRHAREGCDTLSEAELTRRAYALGGMTDHYLSSLHLSAEPGLVAVSTDRAAVIGTLTTLWERGLQP